MRRVTRSWRRRARSARTTFIEVCPNGYDTDVNKRGGRVSAGQRQLISFARAFLANPSVLILDEATSSLDIPSERLVQEALQTLLADRTAVIIAHRLSTVAIADRVLVMEHGRIVEDGTPERPDRRHGALRAAARGLAGLAGLIGSRRHDRTEPPSRSLGRGFCSATDVASGGGGEHRDQCSRHRGRGRWG